MKSRDKYILLFLPVLFFVFFSFYDGVVWCVDSPSYVNMTVDREPVYPLFLLFFRTLFSGNETYLQTAVLVQGLLMAFAIFSLVWFLRKEFKLNIYKTLLIEILFLLVSLLCRFAAKRGSMYSNSLLSESLAYPLFILFFRFVFEYLLTGTKKPLIISTVLSVILISTRKQMYLSLALIVICVFYQTVKQKDYRKILNLILIILVVIGSNKALDYTYNSLIRGLHNSHTSSDRFMATVVFFCSEKDNAELIKDNETKQIFIKVYEACESKGLLKNRNAVGWYENAMDFCDNYDIIQLHNMWPMEREYAEKLYDVSDDEIEVIVDRYNKTIVGSLLPEIWPTVLSTFFCNVLLGIMTTVAAVNRVFMLYSFVIVALYILLMVINIYFNHLDNYSLFGLLVFVSCAINICVVSMVIFPQTRYTIYNMALFYTAGFLMLCDMVNYIRNKKGAEYGFKNK